MDRHLLPGVVIGVSCAVAVSAVERSPSGLDLTRLVLKTAIVGDCRASREALDLAQAESARVWARAGVSIRWLPPSELPYASPTEWLLVRCDGEEPALADSTPSRIMPIAAIRFLGARPVNTIVLHIENAMTLLRREMPQARGEGGWFIPLREKRLGRMLGRAIAHEIGHFLFQSGEHTRSGLMRATHSVAALTGHSLGPFRTPDASHY
jgi:hypothetical protein